MMNIHWSWIAFSIVVFILLVKIVQSSKEPIHDYGVNLTSFFLSIVLIIFILIWGGIFWW